MRSSPRSGAWCGRVACSCFTSTRSRTAHCGIAASRIRASAHLDAPDKVSVKPHASPVFLAIQYLLGNLDRGYLPTLRAFGGLQSYPSRTKDPDTVDFSTGSVGLGADEGIAAHVVDITSADRLYRAWQRTLRHGVRTATAPSIPGALRTVFPDRAPIVTVHDAASHTLSWLGSALGVPAVSLGVDAFGQSGAVADLYRAHDLDAGSIVNAALAALSLR